MGRGKSRGHGFVEGKVCPSLGDDLGGSVVWSFFLALRDAVIGTDSLLFLARGDIFKKKKEHLISFNLVKKRLLICTQTCLHGKCSQVVWYVHVMWTMLEHSPHQSPGHGKRKDDVMIWCFSTSMNEIIIFYPCFSMVFCKSWWFALPIVLLVSAEADSRTSHSLSGLTHGTTWAHRPFWIRHLVLEHWQHTCNSHMKTGSQRGKTRSLMVPKKS